MSSRPRPSGKEKSSKTGETEKKLHFESHKDVKAHVHSTHSQMRNTSTHTHTYKHTYTSLYAKMGGKDWSFPSWYGLDS